MTKHATLSVSPSVGPTVGPSLSTDEGLVGGSDLGGRRGDREFSALGRHIFFPKIMELE